MYLKLDQALNILSVWKTCGKLSHIVEAQVAGLTNWSDGIIL